jgi:hypothetical protein
MICISCASPAVVLTENSLERCFSRGTKTGIDIVELEGPKTDDLLKADALDIVFVDVRVLEHRSENEVEVLRQSAPVAR